eukprot:scaffold1102_cov256-Pinguiococcus_pyrenoidosus.AAC.6
MSCERSSTAVTSQFMAPVIHDAPADTLMGRGPNSRVKVASVDSAGVPPLWKRSVMVCTSACAAGPQASTR